LRERKCDISHGVDGDGEHVVLVGIRTSREISIFDEGELGELHDGAIEERCEKENQEDDDKEWNFSAVGRSLGLLQKQGGTLNKEDEESAVCDAQKERALEPIFLYNDVRRRLVGSPWI